MAVRTTRPALDLEAGHRNLAPAELYEHAVRRGEGMLADAGPLCVVTAPHTGRSPDDKFIVRDAQTSERVWWGANRPLAPEHFALLQDAVARHLAGQQLFVQDLFAGADPDHRVAMRVVTPNAWHALFACNMFLRPTPTDLRAFTPEWQLLHAPELQADPARHGTGSGTFIALDFGTRTILIGGTRHAGEVKKA